MQFRPEAGVVRPDGTLLPDHYWWIAGEWSNLYLVCSACNRHLAGGRGSRFPLEDETFRAPLLASPEALAAEMPLLLDPCEDEPEDHLVFLADGTVISHTERGETTVELLGLNRADLVEARAEHAETIQDMIGYLRPGNADDMVPVAQHLGEMMGPDHPWTGLTRQLVGNLKSLLPLNLRRYLDAGVTQPESRRHTASDRHRDFARRQESFSLARPGDAEIYRSFSRYIERVTIRNVKAIGEMDLDLTRSAALTTPWTVLLGENAAGKSTVLQAITLALIGRVGVERLGLDARAFIRRSPGVNNGWVRVRLSGSHGDRILRFTQKGFRYDNAEEPQTLVLAYGETRLLPAPGLPGASGHRWGRVEGLFRPARALVDARQWLLDASPETFDYVAAAIRDLLGLPESRWLYRDGQSVWVVERNRRISLGELSTGWQSVLATVIDILELVTRFWPTPGSAEGVVLIDELGAHLHPRWRIRVVSGLRRMLPRMQFIVSTHEPLCLRGVEEHETVLMQRDEQGLAHATTDLPSPRDLRVDQLLTSRHFGLGTTLDPEIDARFDEYYQLLAVPESALTGDQQSRRERLAVELQGHGVLGYTRRDQLVYEAIDAFLAAERHTRNPDPGLKETTLRRVRDLWNITRIAESGDERT
ncbi:AAA family ATPase [Actinoplanes sp. CA-252034]|uniref:AAA family ATPase n=1 Tax=Actinoplanes sp. CA-252034 TaxID=3239906 RepID=UPI003D97A460